MDFYFMENIDPKKLLEFFTNRKERIHDILLKKLRQLPPTPYMKFLLDTSEGQRRISIYFANFESALRGQMDVFLSDLDRIGYIRAIQGYQLEDVWEYTLAFKQALSQSVLKYNSEIRNKKAIINIEDVSFVAELIDYSNYVLSFSFIKRRDEIIRRRRCQIHELNKYAVQVVSIFSEKNIWDRAKHAVSKIFGLSGSFLNIKGSDYEIRKEVESVKDFVPKELFKKMVKEIGRSKKALAFDANGAKHLLNTEMEKEFFGCILAPIQTSSFPITHIVLIYDRGHVFKFEKFDRNLLFQFCILTGSVISNCKMVSEVSQKQEDLRNLTRNLISVQENERKKIAADIHDTLTQMLTAIGYKALLCQELVENNILRLKYELNLLIDNINEALSQSRQIISNLRPKILDDIGMLAAFKKVLSDFKQDTNIKINFICPEELQVPPNVRIALYRILQEILRNIAKHAQPSKIDIHLTSNEENVLSLMVQDDGLGFDPLQHNHGLGLMTMRERAEDLGGDLHVYSSLGEGCRIEINIPLKEGEVNASH